jgi:hypothetical protein
MPDLPVIRRCESYAGEPLVRCESDLNIGAAHFRE